MLRRWMVRYGWWLLLLLVFDIWFFMWWRGRRQATEPKDRPASTEMEMRHSASPVTLLRYGFPTAQTNLHLTNDASVFMPTASGRVVSALYGSVRTRQSGPAFHEGIDIAPLQRDRRGRATDAVLAVAEGRVAYANRHAGRSNYGIYVVLEHDDPVGTIYSLYAHLASVSRSLQVNQHVQRGDVLGIMGNTPASIIPVARSHLHFEIGMIQTSRFTSWTREQGMQNLHGLHHGWNLTGIDPLLVFQTPCETRSFSMLATLKETPVAVTLLIHTPRPLDYFERYPALWKAERPPRGTLVLELSEGGVVLSGRFATEQERSRHQPPAVLSVNSDVLGRNGLRLVVPRGNGWTLGRQGERWLHILTH